MSNYSEAQKRATMKYIKANLEEIKIRVPKGKKEEYKAKAESAGKSLTQYIIDLVEEDGKMKRMKKADMIGLQIFNGSEDYIIKSFDEGSKCFIANVLTQDEATEEFIETDKIIRVPIANVESDYKHDFGKIIKIELI